MKRSIGDRNPVGRITMQVKIRKVKKKDNEFVMEITGTQGWLLSIKHALMYYGQMSPIAAEVLDFIKLAEERADLTI